MRQPSKRPREDVAITGRELVTILRIKDRASADAQRQLPTPTDPTEPPALQELRDAIGARINTRHRAFHDRLQALENAMDDLVESDSGSLKIVATEIEDEVMTAFADLEPETRRRISEERSFKSTLAAFRDKRKLYREPLGKDAKLAYFAPVAVSTLAEAGGQAWLYQDVTSAGFLGAVALAIAVSASNAAIGIAGGALPSRAFNERAPWAKALGAIGVVAAGGLIVSLNWAAAKFRDIAAASGDTEAALQVAKLLNAEWSLTIPGAAVFCCGIANATYCWMKGYRGFDPVLGHERLARAYQDKVDAIEDLTAVVDGRLTEILARTVTYGRDRPRARLAEWQTLKRELTALGTLERRNTALEESDLKALSGAIEAYRRTNLYVRADKITPTCLTGAIDVEPLRQTYPSLDHLVTKIDAALAAQAPHATLWVNRIDTLGEIVRETKENRVGLLQAIERHDPTHGQAPELKAVCAALRAVVSAMPAADESVNTCDDGSEPWAAEAFPTKAVA
jgi:hypothetical protein